MTETQVSELERRIAGLKARLPQHSPSARMLIELEELEEALQQARKRLGCEELSPA